MRGEPVWITDDILTAISKVNSHQSKDHPYEGKYNINIDKLQVLDSTAELSSLVQMQSSLFLLNLIRKMHMGELKMLWSWLGKIAMRAGGWGLGYPMVRVGFVLPVICPSPALHLELYNWVKKEELHWTSAYVPGQSLPEKTR